LQEFKFKNDNQIVEYFLRALFVNDTQYAQQIITNIDDLMDLLALVKNTHARPSRQTTYKLFPKTYISQLILQENDPEKIIALETFVKQVNQIAPSIQKYNPRRNPASFNTVSPSNNVQSFSLTELEVAHFLAQIAPPLQQESRDYQLHFFRQPTFPLDEEPVLATVVNKTWA
jgi:hypothetical protein